jgi:nucleoside-diphosphate-sugar epimerase
MEWLRLSPPHADFGLPSSDLRDIFDRVGFSWESIRDSRIFISGGTGFFGRWLLASLCLANRQLDLNVRAYVLTRDPVHFQLTMPELASNPVIRLWPGDVRSFNFPDGKFAFVIHAATDTSQTANSKPSILIDTITNGTRRMLQFANSAGVKRLLYLSSGAVYGDVSQTLGLEAISEDSPCLCDPLNPWSSYSQGKRLAEHYCSIETNVSGVECTIARCFACVGPFLPLDAHFAIGNFIRDAFCNDAIYVRGNGLPLRSYLYVADLTTWLWLILLQGAAGRAYNVGSSDAISIAELALRVSVILGANKPVKIESIDSNIGHRDRYIPCIERAKQELGLQVWTSLDESILRTAAFAFVNH